MDTTLENNVTGPQIPALMRHWDDAAHPSNTPNAPMVGPGGNLTLVDPQGKWTMIVTQPAYNKETDRMESRVTTNHGFDSSDGVPMRTEQNFSVAWSKDAFDEKGNLTNEVFTNLDTLSDGINKRYQGFFGLSDQKQLEYYSTRPGYMATRDSTIEEAFGNMKDLITDIDALNNTKGYSASTIYNAFTDKDGVEPLQSNNGFVVVDPEGKWTTHLSDPVYNEKTGMYDVEMNSSLGAVTKGGTDIRVDGQYSLEFSKDGIDDKGNLTDEALAGIESLHDGVRAQIQGFTESVFNDYYLGKPGPKAALGDQMDRLIEAGAEKLVPGVDDAHVERDMGRDTVYRSFDTSKMEDATPQPSPASPG